VDLHPRAHANGLVEQVIQGALAFPHKMSPEAVQRWIDALLTMTRPTAWPRSRRRRWC
jgi:hypothetical protein